MVKHVSGRAYVVVWLALLGLTTASFLCSLADLGSLDIAIALGIAVAKTTLVLFFFMHLVEERFSTRLVVVASALLVVLLVALTTVDVATRTTFPRAPTPPPSDDGELE